MKRAKSNNGKHGAKRKTAVRSAGKAVNLDDLRQKLAGQVANQASDMVDATIGEVMKGQHQPMKYLFEMIGLYPAGTTEEKAGDDVLARTLLRRLEFPPETAEGEPASEPAPVGVESDSLE